jgi:hypothetical protein
MRQRRGARAERRAAGLSGEDEVARHDYIQLSSIDADVNTAGDQAFVFIGNNNPFYGVGQVRCNGGFVEGDIDGDAIADFRIQVFQNDNQLIAEDFIL